ncbi:MAG: hypothetical protein DMF17_13430, partial [Verrucomicrobia bacterium]
MMGRRSMELLVMNSPLQFISRLQEFCSRYGASRHMGIAIDELAHAPYPPQVTEMSDNRFCDFHFGVTENTHVQRGRKF